MAERKPILKVIQSNLIAGVLTVFPIIAVWIVISFLLALLSSAGAPLAGAITDFINTQVPGLAPVLTNTYVQGAVAVILVLLILNLIGAAASRMLGMRFITFMEKLINRIPLIQTVYRASKQLVGVMHQAPGGAARVVLIDFPHPGLKAIGLVMRTFPDPNTGQEISAVFVPTSPNPTSGYLQLVPTAKLVPSDMTMDQAMTMIVSGGAVTPDHISLTSARTRPES
ncbi:MAG: DUF502 domain-containing protein [Alphaproteobacteria bacterium]